jgi:putative YphP/YqiW family bacilliredoxin
MPYPEQLLIAMRNDLTQYGVEEARTPAALDAALAPGSGTVMVVVNSVCGCAAAKARPAIGMALTNPARPDKAVTVFAGGDVEAVERLRSHYLYSVAPSSPSLAIFQDGKPVYYMHRSEIESRQAPEIAASLKQAFEAHCGAAKS